MLVSYHPEKAHEARSWYQESAPLFDDGARLAGAQHADVAIVGAGYTGLSAALDLAARGYQVAVLEAQSVGWGASGRNGGQMIGGFARDLAPLVRQMGADDVRSLGQIADDAVALIHDRIRTHDIACDLQAGYIYAAEKPRQIAECQAMARADDSGYVFLNRAEITQRLGTDHYLAGVYDPASGHLHPLKYARGLARAACAAGVRIYEHTPVMALNHAADHVVLQTPAGQLRARHVILAGNALLRGLAPAIEPFIMPVGTHIIATEPLPSALAATILPDQPAVCDLNFVLNYFRKTPDHRLLFGGRVSYSGFEMPHVTTLIRQKMVAIFPQIADVPVSHSWGGLIDISMNRMPHLGRIHHNIWYAQGFSGHGVVLTGMAGRILAEAVDGQMARFDLMARIPHRPFPGGRLLRKPALVLAMMWYRLRDLL